MKVKVQSYQDGQDCRETFFAMVEGKEILLSPQSLNSVYTRRHIEKVAKKKFGEDVTLEWDCYLETE